MKGICVNLPRSGRPHKLIDRPSRKVMKESTRTHITRLKELQASAARNGEILHRTTVAHPVRALWESGNKKATVEEQKVHRYRLERGECFSSSSCYITYFCLIVSLFCGNQFSI